MEHRDAIGRAVRIRDSKGCFLFYSEGDKKDAEMDNFLKKDGFVKIRKFWKRWGWEVTIPLICLGLRLFDLTLKDVAIYTVNGLTTIPV